MPAAGEGRADFAVFLLAHNAPVNAKTRFGLTPLKTADEDTEEIDNSAVIRVIKEHGGRD